MRLVIAVCILLLTFSFIPAVGVSEAGSGTEAYLSRLSINQVSIQNHQRKITLYKELLSGGDIVLEGKVESQKMQEDIVVNIGGRDNWQPAAVAPSGIFTFRFRPEIQHDYYLYVGIRDGKDRIRSLQSCQVVVSNTPVITAVKQTLDDMIDAYRHKNAHRFMQYVDSGFTGDDILLHRAIRRDFSRLEITALRYSLDNFAIGDQGRVAVTLQFRRNAVSLQNGTRLRDEGTTQMIFAPGADGLALYSMKPPLLFGISDADYLKSF